MKFPEDIELTNEAKDICLQLLNKDKRKRLGATGGWMKIKKHPWFSDLDFKKLEEKKLPSPIEIRNYIEQLLETGKPYKSTEEFTLFDLDPSIEEQKENIIRRSYSKEVKELLRTP